MRRVRLLAVSALLGALLIASMLVHTAHAQGQFASDGFGRSVPHGWGSADSGGWWSVVGSPWAWSVTPGAGYVSVAAGGDERAYLSQESVQDTDIVIEATLPRSSQSNNEYVYALSRYTAAYTPTYYRVGMFQGPSGNVQLRAQRSDGTMLVSAADTGIPGAAGLTAFLHVQVTGANPTTLKAHAWLPSQSEPTIWTLLTTDSTAAEQVAGNVGIRLRNEDTAQAHAFQVNSYQASGNASFVTPTPNPSGVAHWLYVVDDGQVSIYDIDSPNSATLVKQFAIPEAGKRGVAVAPQQGLLYISECGASACSGSHGSLVAYDLVRDVVAWIATYSFGTDQLAITPNGATIYMPHGADATDGTTSLLDASDGQVTGTIVTGTNGHNTIVSQDGTQAYLSGYTGANFNDLHVVSTATNQVTLQAGPTANGVRPFTVNSENTLAYTTSTNTCGFQALSLVSGTVLSTVSFPGSCTWTASNAPSHGVSLSPDERRVYVIDAPQDEVVVYDVSGPTPSFVANVPLSGFSGQERPCQTFCEREGWTLNDLSGRYVYVGDTGDVISTSSLAVVAHLPALQNTRQVIEVDWSEGLTSATSTRFGLGHAAGGGPLPTPTPGPTSTPTPVPSPTATATPTSLNNTPCTVTLNGVQQTGFCTGTFVP